MTFIEVCKNTGKVKAKVISMIQPKENDTVEYINVTELIDFKLDYLNDISSLYFDIMNNKFVFEPLNTYE
ncbi:hypothetical protein DBL02_17415 [Acinetobacter oleivorans]|uniref:hypothetical protein n=1 Tax=Acinetobacter oleivorans TaxID=1148157 RepID=UPI000D2FDBED|nr:hypothetical protein [Acinetobacter oleivorans]PTV43385.1 hypothetical protein DBL02_17415 [Acinetobacter oleivorans]